MNLSARVSHKFNAFFSSKPAKWIMHEGAHRQWVTCPYDGASTGRTQGWCQRHRYRGEKVALNTPAACQHHSRRCRTPGVVIITRRDQMESGTIVMLSVLFSAIGAGYVLYGRRQRQVVPLLTGLALCVYPYFLAKGFALVVVGLLLTAVPWFLRL